MRVPRRSKRIVTFHESFRAQRNPSHAAATGLSGRSIAAGRRLPAAL